MNSARVAGFSRKSPLIADVTILDLGFFTPRSGEPADFFNMAAALLVAWKVYAMTFVATTPAH